MFFSLKTSRRGQTRQNTEVRSAQIRRMRTMTGLTNERLEDRLALAISTWSGAVDNLWSTPGNWDTLPNAGDTLVFPAGASNLNSVNDFATGTSFESIAIDSAGYDISGNAIAITAGITASYGSGSSTLGLGLDFTEVFPGISVSMPGTELVIEGSIESIASITKGGSGVLTFASAQSFTSALVVNNGALWVNQTIGAPVELNAGAVLAGNGSIFALASTGGIVQPGQAGIGVLAVANGALLDPDSDFVVSLNGPGAAGFGQLAVGGPITLGSAELIVNLNYTPVGADVFKIVDNQGTSAVVGTFAGLPEGSTIMLGSAAFKISYVGGDGNDVTLAHQVATTTTLNSNANPSVYGQSVTLTAEVDSTAGTPTGAVQFFSGATLLSTVTLDATGTATYVTSALEIGTNDLTAVFIGTGGYGTSTSPVVEQVVNQASTIIAVIGEPNPSQLGQSVKFTATVQASNPGSGVPSGTVNFYNAGALIGTGTLNSSGKAELTLTNLTIGTHEITAEYVGDTRYTGSQSTEYPQVVNKIATTATIVSSANPASPGASVTFTATIAPSISSLPKPTGSVNFMNGSTILATVPLDAEGKAVYSTSTLPIGTSSITVSFAGNDDYAASTSSVLSQVVNKVATTTTLTTSVNPSDFGASVTFTATVTANQTGYPAPTGTVEFRNGSTVIGTGTLDSNGKATLTTTALPVGTNQITAVYQSDTNNATSTATAVAQVVGKAASAVSLTATTNYVTAAGLVTFTAKVTPAASGTSAIPTGQVRFLVNGNVVALKTLANGEATYTTNGFQMGLGIDTITAEYVGDTSFNASNSSAVTVVAGTDNERWLNQVFLQVVFQPIDYQSLVKWNDQLQRGSSRTVVATRIRNTPLGRQMLVQQSFYEYLGREGTQDEIRMVQGAAQRTRTSPRAIVLGTPEFYNEIGDGTSEGYVVALETVLGTTFSPGASAMIVHQLNAGQPPFKVAQSVLTSRTGRQALVQQLFLQVLGREPSDQELAAFSWQESRGVYWRQQQSYLLASEEFYELAIAEPGGYDPMLEE